VKARAALAVLVLAGCTTARLPHVPGDPPPAVRDATAEREYEAYLDQYTQTASLYDVLDSKIFFRVVWQSPRFVEARVRREAMFKDLPSAEYQQRLEAEQGRQREATEFFMGVHANESRFEDFSRKDSMWRMVLITDDGRELPPLTVERLGRTSTEMRSYYTFMESFWVGYKLRFPALPAGQHVHLRLSSALGRADLEFKAD
jgi:hypothetical protein